MLVLIFIQFLFAQFPVDLAIDEISEPLLYQAEEESEFLLTLTASANTNWSIADSESATLVVAVDGDWENYNQDLVLYAGNTNHQYYVSLGYLSEGEHTIEFKFDYNKSSMGAELVQIESVDIVDVNSMDTDPDVFLYSPILYGRDLLSWNESVHTDIPLIMFYELEENEVLSAMWPGVVEAARLIGSEQIQGRATLAGNICNASPAADSVPALIAANAQAIVAGPGGTREIAVQDIAVGPGQTILQPGEFVVSIMLPKPAAHSGDAYLRFIPRTEMDIAVVGVGVSLSLDDDGLCSTARVALGAVAPTAKIVEKAPHILVGNQLNDSLMDTLASAARDVCSPIDDKRGTTEFRTKVAGVLTRRATRIAWERAEQN